MPPKARRNSLITAFFAPKSDAPAKHPNQGGIESARAKASSRKVKKQQKKQQQNQKKERLVDDEAARKLSSPPSKRIKVKASKDVSPSHFFKKAQQKEQESCTPETKKLRREESREGDGSDSSSSSSSSSSSESEAPGDPESEYEPSSSQESSSESSSDDAYESDGVAASDPSSEDEDVPRSRHRSKKRKPKATKQKQKAPLGFSSPAQKLKKQRSGEPVDNSETLAALESMRFGQTASKQLSGLDKSKKMSKSTERAIKRLQAGHATDELTAMAGITQQVDYAECPFLNPKKIRDKEGRRPDHPEYNPKTLLIKDQFYKKMTPAQKQYWKIKSTHYDVILFFKVTEARTLTHSHAHKCIFLVCFLLLLLSRL